MRYDSPTIMGFTLSAAAGDDYMYDAALRYAGEWNGLRVAAGVGYVVNLDEGGCDTTNAFSAAAAGNACLGSATAAAKTFKAGRREQSTFRTNASAWHMPTGLFVSGSYSRLEYDGTGGIDNQPANFAGSPLKQRPDGSSWWIGAGLRKNYFGIGDTSVFGEYGKINDALNGAALNLSTSTTASDGAVGNFAVVTDSALTKWGFGLMQNLDKAATTLYVHYMNYSFDVKGCAVATAALTPNCTLTKQGLEDIQAIQAGAIVRF